MVKQHVVSQDGAVGTILWDGDRVIDFVISHGPMWPELGGNVELREAIADSTKEVPPPTPDPWPE